MAGIEARGFILAASVAIALGAGFVPVRKRGKLPGPTYAQSYDLEYGSATIEVHQDAFTPGERVLIVDDVLATGGTAAASYRTGPQVRRGGGRPGGDPGAQLPGRPGPAAGGADPLAADCLTCESADPAPPPSSADRLLSWRT